MIQIKMFPSSFLFAVLASPSSNQPAPVVGQPVPTTTAIPVNPKADEEQAPIPSDATLFSPTRRLTSCKCYSFIVVVIVLIIDLVLFVVASFVVAVALLR